jgi:hypothetical protein
MPYIYSNPEDENDPHKLPNIWITQRDWMDIRCCPECGSDDCQKDDYNTECNNCGYEFNAPDLEGWYWAACFPGCIPDSDFSGPFNTYEEAVEAAREFYND